MDGSLLMRDYNGWYAEGCWEQPNWDQSDRNYRQSYYHDEAFSRMFRVDMPDVVYDNGEFWPK